MIMVMTKDHPNSITTRMGNKHDYLPATGNDLLLPAYDLITRVFGMSPGYDMLTGQAELFADVRVLEIGCGTGNLTKRIMRAQPTAHVTATDPDPRALARARQKITFSNDVRLERVYAERLPYADESFDRVLSSMMLHHLDTEAKAAALREAYRVLRPGGSMHIVDVHGDDLADLLGSIGFEVTELGTQQLRFAGRAGFYRAARFTAETTARSDAVVIDVAMPTPHTVLPPMEAST
jgi:ubiquinone/menaquinone biosynthesis C-methylase UbiE